MWWMLSAALATDPPSAAPPAADSPSADTLPVPTATLVVEIRGVKAARGGILRCAVFDDAQGYPTDPDRRLMGTSSTPNAATCRFDVPPGTYAVSVGHDVNDNGVVDTNLLGIPTEGWGTSNNVQPTFRAPRFDESTLTVPAGETRISVVLRY